MKERKDFPFTAKKGLLDLIRHWKEQILANQEALYSLGAEAHTLKYNLLSAETMRLYHCVVEAQELLLEVSDE